MMILLMLIMVNFGYRAITTSSTGGLQSATCESGSGPTCDIGLVRGALMGVFMLFAVPIYACTMAQFAGIVIERAVQDSRMKLLQKPIQK